MSLSPVCRRQASSRRRGHAVRLVSLLAVAALGAFFSRPRHLSAFFAGGEAEGGDALLADVVDAALQDMQPLQAQVEGGQLVSRFGDKATGILTSLESRTGAGQGAEELRQAVDAMLEALFLQQCTLLRQQVADRYVKAGGNPAETIAQADEEFVNLASQLKRPSSDWSYEEERYALRAVLEATFRSLGALQDENVRAAATQQTTIEVIGKLQSQMEALQQRLQQMKAGSPWFLSSSYRIPKSPFTLISRYQQGRASFELSLNSDRDPANADAGFVDGFGPANIGVKLNVG